MDAGLPDIPELPGVMAYGNKRSEAISKAQVLALRVLADRLNMVRKFRT